MVLGFFKCQTVFYISYCELNLSWESALNGICCILAFEQGFFSYCFEFYPYNFSLRSRKYLHLLWRVWCSANVVSLDSVLSQCSNRVKCLQHSLPLLPSTNLHPPFTYIFFHCSLHLLQFWIFCEVCGMNVEVLQIWIHLIQFSNCGRLLYR